MNMKDESGKESDVVEGTGDDQANEGSGVGGTKATDGVMFVNGVHLMPYHMDVPQLRGWEKVLGDKKSYGKSSSHVPRHAHSVARAVEPASSIPRAVEDSMNVDSGSSGFPDPKDLW